MVIAVIVAIFLATEAVVIPAAEASAPDGGPAASPGSGTPPTLYVDAGSAWCAGGRLLGGLLASAGTRAMPYCTIQAAADVVTPGQRVDIEQSSSRALYTQSVTFTRSGTPSAPVVFAGVDAGHGLPVIAPPAGKTPVTFDHVHDVTVESAGISYGGNADGVDVNGSWDVTVDSTPLTGGPWGTGAHNTTASPTGNTATGNTAAVRVDGGSSAVMISRAQISGAVNGVIVAPGATMVTITTSALQLSGSGGTGIGLDGVGYSFITSDTVITGCGDAVSVAGGSAAIIENNVLTVQGDDCATGAGTSSPAGAPAPASAAPSAAPSTAGSVAPPAALPAAVPSPIAALSVDQSSETGTRADYNSLQAASPAAEYAWGGTGYASSAGFAAATGQGGHDGQVPAAFGPGQPPEGSPVVDSADCTAPGELLTDIDGNPRARDPMVSRDGAGTCYADRGAWEREDSVLPGFTVGWATGAGLAPLPLSVTVTSPATSAWGEQVSYAIDFGDGSAPVPASPGAVVQHAYQLPGTYQVTVTGTDTTGSSLVATTTARAL
jgi:hypothetical protein